MTQLKHTLEAALNASITLKKSLLTDTQFMKMVETATQLILTAFQNGHTVYFCGNGGSAADAQHLAAEFTGRYYLDRPPLPSEALHVNASFMTAVANDYDFETTYERLIDGIGKPGDILVSLSTSGTSANVVRAAKKAQEKGLKTISLTGESGGDLLAISDVTLCIPSTDTPRIQECHMLIGHTICEDVEARFFAAGNT